MLVMSDGNELFAVLERIGRLVQNDGHAHGLKPVQWEVLRYLARANRFSRNHAAVTAYLGTTKGTVSQTLKALEAKGLIARTRSAHDGRAVDLSLTETGLRLLRDDPVEALRAVTARLPSDNRIAAETTLKTLLTEVSKQRDWRPFGLCKTCRHFARAHDRGAPHYCRLLNVPLSTEDSGLICVEQESGTGR